MSNREHRANRHPDIAAKSCRPAGHPVHHGDRQSRTVRAPERDLPVQRRQPALPRIPHAVLHAVCRPVPGACHPGAGRALDARAAAVRGVPGGLLHGPVRGGDRHRHAGEHPPDRCGGGGRTVQLFPALAHAAAGPAAGGTGHPLLAGQPALAPRTACPHAAVRAVAGGHGRRRRAVLVRLCLLHPRTQDHPDVRQSGVLQLFGHPLRFRPPEAGPRRRADTGGGRRAGDRPRRAAGTAGACRRRNRSGRPLLAERLCAQDQSAAGGRERAQPDAGDLVRNVNGGIAALHVLGHEAQRIQPGRRH